MVEIVSFQGKSQSEGAPVQYTLMIQKSSVSVTAKILARKLTLFKIITENAKGFQIKYRRIKETIKKIFIDCSQLLFLLCGYIDTQRVDVTRKDAIKFSVSHLLFQAPRTCKAKMQI